MSRFPRLLIVDDEPVQRAFAHAALAGAGWAIDEAGDGAAALAAIAATRYALVLLDIQMPPPDGFAIARAIRAGAGGDRTVPILAFTALAGGDLAACVAAAGMDGHIPKPLAAPLLVARVAPWWPHGASPARARLARAFGGFEIAELTARFFDQLGDALDRIAEPDGAARAHRIAGLAGTLGFPDVHDAWLALSEGGAAAPAAAIARRTLRSVRSDAE